MGIQIEFNPDLALRAFGTLGRLEDECVPEKLEVGRIYPFLKKGQRNFWFGGEIPLLMTEGNQNLSRPIASVTIIKATHYMKNGEVYTAGNYVVNEVFDPKDPIIHFEGRERIK